METKQVITSARALPKASYLWVIAHILKLHFPEPPKDLQLLQPQHHNNVRSHFLFHLQIHFPLPRQQTSWLFRSRYGPQPSASQVTSSNGATWVEGQPQSQADQTAGGTNQTNKHILCSCCICCLHLSNVQMLWGFLVCFFFFSPP